MVKDRLLELQRIQAGLEPEQQVEEETYFCPLDKMCVALGNRLKQIGEIQDNIRHLKAYVQNAKELYSDFESSPVEQKNIRDKLNKLAENITCLSNCIRQQLKEIQPEVKSKCVEERVKALHYRSLLRLFFTTMHEYNSSVEKYQQRRKQCIKRQMDILGQNTLSETKLEELLEKDNYICSVRHEIDMDRQHVSELQNRHSEIKSIESGITQLHNMFIDIHNMVSRQATELDHIEYEVAQSQGRIESASQSTNTYHKATPQKKKSPKRTILLPFQMVKRICQKVKS